MKTTIAEYLKNMEGYLYHKFIRSAEAACFTENLNSSVVDLNHSLPLSILGFTGRLWIVNI